MHSNRQDWAARPLAIPRALRQWLCDRGSLTRCLQARCSGFRVQALATGRGQPHADETHLLGLACGQPAYFRNVLLHCGETPVVFAHSVLPLSALRGGWKRVTRLGNRSLGEALFRNPRIQRQSLAFCRIRRAHPLHRALAQHHPEVPAALWARRSVFGLRGHPLLVTEVFLPAVEAL